MDREKIKESAKQIMDEFYSEIGSIDLEFKPKTQGKGTRDAKTSKITMTKEELFKNAPKKNDNYIIAERKSW